jgi:hypothetical protein
MITMCMNVIKASFYMQNWSNVLSYVSKAEQAIESLESTTKSSTTPSTATVVNPMEVSTTNAMIVSDAILASRLKVYAGMAELATKRYKLATKHFLGVSFDHCSNHFQVNCQNVNHESISFSKQKRDSNKKNGINMFITILGSNITSNSDSSFNFNVTEYKTIS